MEIPDQAQELIKAAIQQLEGTDEYYLAAETRDAIYAALGPSSVPDEQASYELIKKQVLPELTFADRVRVRISYLTARRAQPLWLLACEETYTNHNSYPEPTEMLREEAWYLGERKQKQIEHISVFQVPQAFIVSHILEMVELALSREMDDLKAFLHESNEWWGIYPTPEMMEREFFIKWAAHDALYEAIGWGASRSPAEHAVYAYAAIFSGDDLLEGTATFDPLQAREFFNWWLQKAIPTA